MSVHKRSRKPSTLRKLQLVLGDLQFHRTPFDIPLVIFFLLVLWGTWAAPSIRLALFKFWMMLGALVLYYMLTAVPRRYAWWAASLCGPLTAVLAVYFMTFRWWHSGMALVGGVIRPVFAVLVLRRFWPILTPHPNVIGGLIAMCLPFALAFGLYARREGQKRAVIVTAVCGGIGLGGLLVTQSTGALLAFSMGINVWLLWELSRWLAYRFSLPRQMMYACLLMGMSLLGGIVFFLIVNQGLPGSGSLIERLLLVEGTWRLVQDFVFLGSGLASFAALYAEYIQVVPNFYVSYGNLYLDVLLELGIIGFACLLWVWLGAGWVVIKALRRNMARPFPERGETYWLRWATLASIVIILVHGLTDDTLFGGLGTPVLFFAPAMAVLTSRRLAGLRPVLMSTRQWVLVGGVFLLIVVGVGGVFRQDLRASWLSAQGALQMDQVLLREWPQNEWRRDEFSVLLEPARMQFEAALSFNKGNRTARQRLGMIALLRHDFDTAVMHLEQAQQSDPEHRGVKKALGYAYIWQDQPDKALVLLIEIPEAEREIGEYATWWQHQDRPDLAEQAAAMLNLMNDVKNGQ